MKPIAELNARSAFSFLRGASHPETLVRRAAALGYGAIALTDEMGFYGSARAHQAAKEAGIRALVGTSLRTREGGSFPLLVATRTGYENACQLLTRSHLARGAEPATAELTGPHGSAELTGLVCLTGDESSPLSRLLAANRRPEALACAESLVRLFGPGNVHVEILRHHLRGEEHLNRLRIDLAKHLRLPLVACQAPLFAARDDRPLADAFACLREKSTLDDAGMLLAANGERFLKPPAELATLFKDLPEALANASTLAENLEFSLNDLGYEFPAFRDPASGILLDRAGQDARLRDEAFRGARHRCGGLPESIRDRLNEELALIAKLGFAGYFLVVWGIKEFARREGILCQGRGSAANSVVCYALGITNVDPLSQNLLFARFLSENRSNWPDIDIDFPSGEGRERVIQHVYETYAPHGAAMTANVITYKPRSAFREMSKVLGFGPETAARFSEIAGGPRISEPGEGMLGDGSATETPNGQIEHLEESIIQAGIPANHPRFTALLDLCLAVQRMPRHLSQHPGGMVICNRGLNHIVPLEPAAMPNRTLLQWDKDDCEDLGIVKVDLLGLGMMAAMQEALVICAARGEPVDLAKIPLDDPATFDLLCRADTVGTFQVESRAQMATLPILRPKSFYDVAIEVAIIRPGPIVGDLVHPYLNRRTGREPVDFIHPSFKKILGRTLGVPLFQEQVLEMAMVIADFSGGEADELRRAMAFKRDDGRMTRVVEKLDHAMLAKGVDAVARRRIIDSIQSFALYGFPESHAISFALLAYASCWLKVHRPAAFYASLLNNQPMGFYSPATLIRDAKGRGLRVHPVCVVESQLATRVTAAGGLRLGLARIKGLTSKTAERIVTQRESQPFASLGDFLDRVRPDPRARRLLAEAGALNALEAGLHRRSALWEAELPLSTELLARRSQPAGPSPLAAMNDHERLAADFATQGHTTGPHPMALWRKNHSGPMPLRARDLPAIPHGRRVTVAGMVICRQRPGTAKGHCFLSMEDETGISNIFIHRRTFEANRLLIGSESFLHITGKLQLGEGNVISVFAEKIHPLDFAASLPVDSHDFH
jgi:error-prone DNA polymerase